MLCVYLKLLYRFACCFWIYLLPLTGPFPGVGAVFQPELNNVHTYVHEQKEAARIVNANTDVKQDC